MENHFGSLGTRTAAIRARLLDTQPAVCTERAVLATNAYRAHEMEQVVLRRAYMLDNVLRNVWKIESGQAGHATSVAARRAGASAANADFRVGNRLIFLRWIPQK